MQRSSNTEPTGPQSGPGDAQLTDWSKISSAPGQTSPPAVIDPGVCSAVAAVDAKILRDRELDELRRLFDACVDWQTKTNPKLRNGPDKQLAAAIVRARRQR